MLFILVIYLWSKAVEGSSLGFPDDKGSSKGFPDPENKKGHPISVADPGCLSLNPDPNFSIPDPHQKKFFFFFLFFF